MRKKCLLERPSVHGAAVASALNMTYQGCRLLMLCSKLRAAQIQLPVLRQASHLVAVHGHVAASFLSLAAMEGSACGYVLADEPSSIEG